MTFFFIIYFKHTVWKQAGTFDNSIVSKQCSKVQKPTALLKRIQRDLIFTALCYQSICHNAASSVLVKLPGNKVHCFVCLLTQVLNNVGGENCHMVNIKRKLCCHKSKNGAGCHHWKYTTPFQKGRRPLLVLVLHWAASQNWFPNPHTKNILNCTVVD